MSDIINLKKFRKRVSRENSAKQAEINRVRFGRTKAERTLAKSQNERSESLLNQHHLDGEKTS